MRLANDVLEGRWVAFSSHRDESVDGGHTLVGLGGEVAVGLRNGLDQDSVVNLDSIATVPQNVLVRPIGALIGEQEHDLTRALHEAFDLED